MHAVAVLAWCVVLSYLCSVVPKPSCTSNSRVEPHLSNVGNVGGCGEATSGFTIVIMDLLESPDDNGKHRWHSPDLCVHVLLTLTFVL